MGDPILQSNFLRIFQQGLAVELYELAMLSRCCVCSRLSPAQKRQIVEEARGLGVGLGRFRQGRGGFWGKPWKKSTWPLKLTYTVGYCNPNNWAIPSVKGV